MDPQQPPSLQLRAEDLADRIAKWGREGENARRVPDDLRSELEEWRGPSEQTVRFSAKLC